MKRNPNRVLQALAALQMGASLSTAVTFATGSNYAAAAAALTTVGWAFIALRENASRERAEALTDNLARCTQHTR